MKIVDKLLKKIKEKKSGKLYDQGVIRFVIEKLKPWIVLNCLEKENYIITDSQAESLSLIIIQQAISLDVFDSVMHRIGIEI